MLIIPGGVCRYLSGPGGLVVGLQVLVVVVELRLLLLLLLLQGHQVGVLLLQLPLQPLRLPLLLQLLPLVLLARETQCSEAAAHLRPDNPVQLGHICQAAGCGHRFPYLARTNSDDKHGDERRSGRI